MNQKSNIFIAYSHDSDQHKEWVANFASRLSASGFNVILDQFDLKLGMQIHEFIESSINNSEKVLVICTDQYVQKATQAIGGVGYEKMILTRELLRESQSDKFIPIVRQSSDSSGQAIMPNFMGTRLFADFRDGSNFESEFKKLVDHLHETLGTYNTNATEQPINLVETNQTGYSPRITNSDRVYIKELFDFNIKHSRRHFDTLNRLVLDVNNYYDLNISFDREISYRHEHYLGDSFDTFFDITERNEEYCGIYEFLYKYLNNNENLENSNYSDGLLDIIRYSNHQQMSDYLQKLEDILKIFADVMVSNDGIISSDFPNGKYDRYTFDFVKEKLTRRNNIKIKSSGPIRVTFPDRSWIQEKNASNTLVNVIERLGVQRIYQLRIGTNQRPLISMNPIGDYYKRDSSGRYYILVATNTKQKIEQLRQISERLNLDLIVEDMRI